MDKLLDNVLATALDNELENVLDNILDDVLLDNLIENVLVATKAPQGYRGGVGWGGRVGWVGQRRFTSRVDVGRCFVAVGRACRSTGEKRCILKTRVRVHFRKLNQGY